MKAELRNNRIEVEANFIQKDRILTLPGARYDRQNQICTLLVTWASCKQLRAILGDNLEIGKNLYEWATNEVQERITPCLELRQAIIAPDTLLCEGLYPFQQAGAMFLVTAKQAILADPMGAGKTIQAIAAAKYIEENLDSSLPALVVCPNSMKRTWQREIEQWWPGIPVQVIEGTKAQKRQKILDTGKGFCIINWEACRLFSNLAPYGSMRLSEEERRPKELNLTPWELVIADEAHRLKDPTSKQTRAVWAVSQDIHYRWALTGTPVTNTPDTLYPILRYLDRLEWPSKIAYVNRYCDAIPSRWGPGLDILGLSEEMKNEFFEIFDPRFRRMPKEVILPDLPPIQRVRRHVDMTDSQARAYRTMVEDMVARDENDELIIAVNPVSKLTRLVQFASASVTLEDGITAKLSNPSSKLDQLMIDLPDYIEADESVVVFAVSRQLIELAEKRLTEKKIAFSVIKGKQTEKVRQQAIDDFQEGKVPVILVVIAAGGVGLTLTRGRIAIFLQRPWSNVDYNQAMARIHRIGSEIHESIMIVDYVTNRTIENYQLRALEGKARQLEEVVRDQDAIRRMLHGEEEETERG